MTDAARGGAVARAPRRIRTLEIIEEEDASSRAEQKIFLALAGDQGPWTAPPNSKEEEAPKPKPKVGGAQEEDDDEDDVSSVRRLDVQLGLEDDEEEEAYVRRDNKKDK